MTWHCAFPPDCGAALSGGDYGPRLDAVLAHLRERHGDVPFDEAWARFRHRWGSARRPVDAAVVQTSASAPETSRAAARRALPRAGTQRRAVYDHIARRGDLGATDDEIEVALALLHQTASATRNGLRDDGWLRDSGRRRQTRSERAAIVWVVTGLAE